jgi:hypothetical protein
MAFLAVFVLAISSEVAWGATRQMSLTKPFIQSNQKNFEKDKRAILIAGKKNRRDNEWQTLTPQEKDKIWHNWNRLNQKPEQDRQDIQRLHNKWQKLSPEERQQIERALENWDNLPPQEKDSIRRRFK